MTMTDFTQTTFLRRARARALAWGAVLLVPLLLISPAKAQAPVEVSVPDTTAQEGDTVTVPIRVRNLDQAEDVVAFGFDLVFDEEILAYVDFETEGTLSEEANFTVSDNPKIPRLGGFSATSLNAEASSGVLLRLKFEIVGIGSGTVRIEALQFNEGVPPASPATPEFEVTGTEEPSESSESEVGTSGGGDATVDFGNTGVEATFRNVQSGGTARIDFFEGRSSAKETLAPSPQASAGFVPGEEFNRVSPYRWQASAGGLTFRSVDFRFRLNDEDIRGVGDPRAVTVIIDSTGDGRFERTQTRFDDRGTPTDSTDDVLVAEGVETLGTFRFASDSSANPLPVELAEFSVVQDGTAALLTWRTASETDNAGFEVQHQTPGSSRYQTKGFVEGTGTTTEPEDYRFRVQELGSGTHRFRLRQIDTDGTSHLSDPVTLTVTAPQALSLRITGANPVRQATRVTFTVPKAGPATVVLYNVLGQRVEVLYDQTATPGRHTVEVDVDHLPSGTYFVQLKTSSGTHTENIAVVQ